MTRTKRLTVSLIPIFSTALLVLTVSCNRNQPLQTVEPARSESENSNVPPPSKVFLEIDRMAGTPALKPEQVIRNNPVSLAGIYAEAGLDLRITQDSTDLPRQETIRLADLHGLMTAFSSLEAEAGERKIYGIVVTEDQDEPGTLGIMFDFGQHDENDIPREAFAIFASAHQGLDGGVDPEMLLTAAHELAHCFNLHHPDWEGTSFQSRATIESYSLADTVRWNLSSQSIAHLQGHPDCLVWPGSSAQKFGVATAEHLARHKISPNESFDEAQETDVCSGEGAFTTRRSSAARAVAARKETRMLSADDTSLRLVLSAPKSTFVVGEPVVLTAELRNVGTTQVAVSPLLNPDYQFLNVEIRRPDMDRFHRFRPAVLADARGARLRRLAPGESMLTEIRVFFGAEGWTFAEPGSYAVRADFGVGDPDGRDRVASNVLELEILEPARTADIRARTILTQPDGQLSTQAGLYLLFEGGDHLTQGAGAVRQIGEEADAAQAPAARLALAMAALNPPARAGLTQEAPAVEQAQEYLSGILDTDLPPATLVRVQSTLARELDSQGQTEAALRIREETIRELDSRSLERPEKDQLKRRMRPPG